jgi:hypothetical protein
LAALKTGGGDFKQEELRWLTCGENIDGLGHGCGIEMILARRALLFSGVHKVSTTLWVMSRMITRATNPELFRGLVAGRIVFHR